MTPSAKPDVIARWSASKLLNTAAAFLGIVLTLLVLASIDKASDTPKPFAFVALAVIASLIVELILIGLRSEVVLTQTDLRIGGRRRTRNSIGLDQVNGIAVVRAWPGWAIFIWAGDAAPARLPAPERVFRLKAQSRAPADAAYWSQVADSPAGTAAQQIYRQAQVAQGPAGAVSWPGISTLIMRDRQLFRGVDTRWWSPSDEHGITP